MTCASSSFCGPIFGIRRPDAREVMFDLGRVRASIPEGDTRLLLDKAIANLMRIWGEP